MTPSAAVADFGGRRYRRFIPFNFFLSLAAPHLHGVLVVDTAEQLFAGDNDISDEFIAGNKNKDAMEGGSCQG